MNPDVRHTSALVRQVAHELAKAGWRLKAVSTDNGSEFKSSQFTQTVADLGAKHRFIRGSRRRSPDLGHLRSYLRFGAL